jgi:hypothetical protein
MKIEHKERQKVKLMCPAHRKFLEHYVRRFHSKKDHSKKLPPSVMCPGLIKFGHFSQK